MNSISVPPSMYKSALTKLLYVAHDNGCLFEFLTHNKIDNIAEVLNEQSEKQSLLCQSALASNDSEVSILISMGANPMLTSQIVVDGCDEIGLRESYDESYDMRDETFYVCDLAIIAKQCKFETFTKTVDHLLSQGELDFNELIESLIRVHVRDLDRYLRYVLSELCKKQVLDLNSNYGSHLSMVYEEYKKTHDSTIFGTLFEYGLLSTTDIDYQFTVKDLMEKDDVIRRLYEGNTFSSFSKRAK